MYFVRTEGFECFMVNRKWKAKRFVFLDSTAVVRNIHPSLSS
jgi:hypothetical protein